MKTHQVSNRPLQIRIENTVPILSVKDMQASRAFYVDLLGFAEAPWGDNRFTHFGRDNGGIYVCQGGQGNPGAWVWLGFDGDIIALCDQLRAKGVAIRQPPVNYSWAMEMHVEDPDGNVLRFGTDPDDGLPFADQEK